MAQTIIESITDQIKKMIKFWFEKNQNSEEALKKLGIVVADLTKKWG